MINIDLNNQSKDLNFNNIILEHLSKYNTSLLMGIKFNKKYDISTDYFLESNSWSINFFNDISIFNKSIKYSNSYIKDAINFNFKRKRLNNEMKFIIHYNIFSGKWNITTALGYEAVGLELFADFINIKYPNIISLLELSSKDIYKVSLDWVNWLIENNHKYHADRQKNFIRKRISELNSILEQYKDINEWDKDRWDIRILKKLYSIKNEATDSSYYIVFENINNKNLRTIIKKYVKTRLLAGNNFSINTAKIYPNKIAKFTNFLDTIHPNIIDFKDVCRDDIQKYIEYLNTLAKDKTITKNPEQYISSYISNVENFLSYLQLFNEKVAPTINIKKLILPGDKPRIPKKSTTSYIDYIPDFVLEQMFKNINLLSNDIVGVVYVMLKTGLRVSDVLTLNYDCLLRLNNQYWIEANISKTAVQKHRIPIDTELAKIIAVLIDRTTKLTTKENNPKRYIFASTSGKRKGMPITKDAVRMALNRLSKKCNIVDELGNQYHFKNHKFRHTYAIKLLNNGVDILTVQELLAHASPEMTMRYARLLDDTKRKTFDNAIKQGIFSFDENSNLKENNEEIPSDILNMLYTNHKLNALDTPYGTCMQKVNGRCTFAKQPPCLTCNKGAPCKDLCIGAFEGDKVKYEILLDSTKKMISNAKKFNRQDTVDENQELLTILEDIYSKISAGNLIYSRIDRLRRKI